MYGDGLATGSLSEGRCGEDGAQHPNVWGGVDASLQSQITGGKRDTGGPDPCVRESQAGETENEGFSCESYPRRRHCVPG